MGTNTNIPASKYLLITMVSHWPYLSELAGAGAGAGADVGAAAGVLAAGAAALSVLAGALSLALLSPVLPLPLGGGTTVPSEAFLSPAVWPVLPFLKSVTYQPVPLSANPAAEIFL
jgi:hypothetical protein